MCCVRTVGDDFDIAGIPKVRCSEAEVLGRLPLLVGGRESYLGRGRLSRLRCLLRGWSPSRRESLERQRDFTRQVTFSGIECGLVLFVSVEPSS